MRNPDPSADAFVIDGDIKDDLMVDAKAISLVSYDDVCADADLWLRRYCQA